MSESATHRIEAFVLLVALSSAPLAAQTSYYNLDGSRPLRVEDAIPTERNALDVEFAPFRVERYPGGMMRWRAEPKLSYGVLPLTELEVRVPIVAVASSRRSRTAGSGVAGVAIGALHAFGVETGNRPAIALGSEVLIAAGPFAGPRTSYTLKGLVTRTGSLGRLELNAAYGTYSVRTVPPPAPATVVCQPTDLTCNPGVVLPPPFDFPCAPPIGVGQASHCGPQASGGVGLTNGAPYDPTRSSGAHWVTGLGVDHAFGLRSLLISADIVAERFVGLYALTDWTTEVGLRHQLSQHLVVDAGVGRRFAGVVQVTTATLGATWEFAVRPPLGVR